MVSYRTWSVLGTMVMLQGALSGCTQGTTVTGDASRPGDHGTTQSPGATPDSVPLAFRIIPGARMQTSAHVDAARLVIRDAAAWERFWGRIVDQIAPTPPVPSIDFAREIVLAASMGQRTSGGYTIDVTAVYRKGETTHVVVKSISPGPQCGVAAVMTAPVVAVAIDRVVGEVRFVEQAETTNCR